MLASIIERYELFPGNLNPSTLDKQERTLGVSFFFSNFWDINYFRLCLSFRWRANFLSWSRYCICQWLGSRFSVRHVSSILPMDMRRPWTHHSGWPPPSLESKFIKGWLKRAESMRVPPWQEFELFIVFFVIVAFARPTPASGCENSPELSHLWGHIDMMSSSLPVTFYHSS